jgi:GntR family transcriptional regulator
MTESAATLDRHHLQPLYLQLADTLEREIARGRFPPYARLMSESALMRRFDVSRVTVRAAITRLVQKGLVDVRQGKGTFVAGPVVQQELARVTGLYDVLLAHGFKPDRRLLEYRPATTDECAGTPFAGREPTHPMLLRRLYLLHGKPFAVVHGLLAPAIAPASRREAAAQTIRERLARYRAGVARADVAIRARPVVGEVGALLGVPRRRAVLVMERTSRASDDALLDHSLFYILPESWEFRLSMAGPCRDDDGPPPRDDDDPPLNPSVAIAE